MSNTETGNNSIMDYELRKYESRTRKSFELFNQAKESTPFGVHSNYRYIYPYPMYGTRAKRSRIWDVDGNEYLDFNGFWRTFGWTLPPSARGGYRGQSKRWKSLGSRI